MLVKNGIVDITDCSGRMHIDSEYLKGFLEWHRNEIVAQGGDLDATRLSKTVVEPWCVFHHHVLQLVSSGCC